MHLKLDTFSCFLINQVHISLLWTLGRAGDDKLEKEMLQLLTAAFKFKLERVVKYLIQLDARRHLNHL